MNEKNNDENQILHKKLVNMVEVFEKNIALWSLRKDHKRNLMYSKNLAKS